MSQCTSVWHPPPPNISRLSASKAIYLYGFYFFQKYSSKMAPPELGGLWGNFVMQKKFFKNSTRAPRYCSSKKRGWARAKFSSIVGAVPLYVEQGSLLYRTGQQFSKSSLGRLETDQLSRVGIGSSFRATATLDPVWEYSLRIGKSSVDEGASAPEQLLFTAATWAG